MEQSQAVRDAALEFYRSISSTDSETAISEQTTSDDDAALLIGTDEDEWVEGRQGCIAAFTEQAQAGVVVEPGDIQAYAEGTVGWIADRPTVVLPDGRRIRTRVTAVYRLEDGRWRQLASHMSVGGTD
jgi:SnoaL-like domain